MGKAIDEAIWRQRRLWIEKQRRSGLSAAEFCRVNELKSSNFYAWNQRLQAEPAHKPLATAKGKLMTQQLRGRGVFVQMPTPVQAVLPVLPVVPEVPAMPWVEFSQADGLVVRVPAANLAALWTVLGVLVANEELRSA